MEHSKNSHSFTDCLSCLLDTEQMIQKDIFTAMSEGNKLRYMTYRNETLQLQKTLHNLQPKTILDIGSGAGRIIQTCISQLPETQVRGVEIDEKNSAFLKKRFQSNPRVHIIQDDIHKMLAQTDQQFDIALCMMTTDELDNYQETLQKILQHTNHLIFTVYNEKYNADREKMYQARGHRQITFDGREYCLNDERSKGLKSRSRSEEEIYTMIEKAGGRVVECKQLGILFYVIATS
ncbi:MAG: class I SAM-dependent methyltransferase [Candidatus Absconditabacterales bacterium]